MDSECRDYADAGMRASPNLKDRSARRGSVEDLQWNPAIAGCVMSVSEDHILSYEDNSEKVNGSSSHNFGEI